MQYKFIKTVTLVGLSYLLLKLTNLGSKILLLQSYRKKKFVIIYPGTNAKSCQHCTNYCSGFQDVPLVTVSVLGDVPSQTFASSPNSLRLLRSQMTEQQRDRLRQRDRDRYQRRKNNLPDEMLDRLQVRIREQGQRLTQTLVDENPSILRTSHPLLCEPCPQEPLTPTATNTHSIPALPSASTHLPPIQLLQNPPPPVQS